MKSKAFRHLVWLVASFALLLSLTPACTQTQAPPPTIPQVTQPPTPVAASENQSAKETITPPSGTAANEETWYPVVNFSGVINKSTDAFHIYGTEWHLKWTIDADNTETAVFKVAIYPKDEPFFARQTFSNDGDMNGTLDYFMSSVDKRDLFIKVTAQNLRQWTISIEDNAIAATSYPVQIYLIHYKGTVYPPNPKAGFCYERVEPDEYVVIKNLSNSYQDVTGWTLKNISKPSPTFKFPPYTMDPGEILRVYTDEYHEETGALTFYYGYGDIWSNDHSDIAVLYDAFGNEVSRKSYDIRPQINEGAQ